MKPTSLYKYLPFEFVPSVLNRGEILFRNLTYFRQYEGIIRGDVYESIFRHSPQNETVFNILTNGKKIVLKTSFLHSTDSEQIYAYCLSEQLSKNLMVEFKSNACIEIFNPHEFIRRVRFAVMRLISVHSNGLLAQPVIYYDAVNVPDFDYNDPKKIIFAKENSYAWQNEYRLCFGKKRAFKFKQEFTLKMYDPHIEAMKGVCKDKIIKIGNLKDIARLIIP
ncbi:hypothetical protein [Nitrosomonas ureae]|uniref:Uncharacterized protein n=1 Tax=Nitrosomonas ureae TaxID=44577 RepID=A0A2T5ISR0_9PROT|nr:hypothetical protein [Nitrosomonas ureae]PTQ86881.1 hypothetical protein C8R28_100876 [Nitrosomonas ureae]